VTSTSHSYLSIFENLQQCPLVPVIVINDIEDAAPMGEALHKAGIRIAEITFRTPQAAQAISEMKAHCPELVVGAGTILNADQLDTAINAGSDFIVTPGTTPNLLNALAATTTPIFPGASTASEVLNLYERGYEYIKFFPAEASGGTAALKSFGGPIPQVKFMPTGGIDQSNVHQYLALKNVIAVGGSWMIDANFAAQKNWREFQKSTEAFVDNIVAKGI